MRNDAIPGADRVRGPAVRFGLMRAAAASPAMFGSMLLVLVAGGGLGAWALVVALTWACCGAVLLTPGGERAAVRAAFGFRRPNSEPAAVLQPLWSAALRLAGASVDDVELYVQRAWQLNAYATGGRSVAVTSRVLDDHRAGRLSDDQVVAVLVHELGHHATGATRPMLLAMWLAAPYRAAARLLSGTGRALCGRQSRRDFTVMGIPVMGVAVVRAVYQGHWLAGGVAGRHRTLRGGLPAGRRVDLPACRVCCRSLRGRPRLRARAGRRAPCIAWPAEYHRRLVPAAARNPPNC
jgi:STE24 endopeptidase